MLADTITTLAADLAPAEAAKMKKVLGIVTILLFAVALIGCDKTTTTTEASSSIDMTVLKFPHLDGHGAEVMKDMPILFEYEMRDYVKYQIAFVSCTCRAPRDNFWSVAYVDVSTETGEILYMSFDIDSSGHYEAGVWGDSDPTPTGMTYDDFKTDFIPWLIGKTYDDLDGINVFYNDIPDVYAAYSNTKTIAETDLIDAFAGSSVSTHTIIRATKTLLQYHEATYMD